MLRHLPDQRFAIGFRHFVVRFNFFTGVDTSLETIQQILFSSRSLFDAHQSLRIHATFLRLAVPGHIVTTHLGVDSGADSIE